MLKVYKYNLNLGFTSLKVPADADILSVGQQDGLAKLWALVDPEKPTEERRFVLVGTGHEIHFPLDTLHFVGRVTHAHFEWHVFEVREVAQ